MKVRTFFLLMIAVAIAVFVILNWNAFMTPTTLSLGVAAVQAPLGLVMLGILVFSTALFLLFVVYMQTSVLLEARRHARELQANRELADKAEASRITELRELVETQANRQSDMDAESRAVVLERLDRLDRDLRSMLEETGNSLGAYIGELGDRLDRDDRMIRPRP